MGGEKKMSGRKSWGKASGIKDRLRGKARTNKNTNLELANLGKKRGEGETEAAGKKSLKDCKREATT